MSGIGAWIRRGFEEGGGGGERLLKLMRESANLHRIGRMIRWWGFYFCCSLVFSTMGLGVC